MTSCPYCQSLGTLIRKFHSRNSEQLNLLRCNSCSCEFLNPQPSEEWLAHEYAGYFKMRQGRGIVSKSRLCKFILSKIGPISQNQSVLEIGGGEGYFVRELLAVYPGIDVTIIEPQADESQFTGHKVTIHKMPIESWLTCSSDRRYDVIVAMDLIEHLRQPLEVFKTLVSTKLNEGGKLIITTPNSVSIFRHMLGRFWPHYKVEHLNYPTNNALSHLAQETNLRITELSSLSKPLQIDYILTILQSFGPQAVRKVGRILSRLCPHFIRTWHLVMPSGELLFVAAKDPLGSNEHQ